MLTAFNAFASSGVIFSTEQRLYLANSLTLVKSNYRFDRLEFWGKIQGIKEDYFIVQGFRNGISPDVQTLYSINCIDWCLLEMAEGADYLNALRITGRFTGDPSATFYVEKQLPEGEEAPKNPEHILILEEVRLSSVIQAISKEAMIVPIGSLLKDGSTNMLWAGLSLQQAKQTKNWEVNGNPVHDSLFWSIQEEVGNGVDRTNVVLRNLLWLGAIAVHTADSSFHSKIYVGTGEKNHSLPFMLTTKTGAR